MIAGHRPPPAHLRVSSDDFVPAASIGQGKYGDRLLLLVDQCLALDYLDRPASVREFLALFFPEISSELRHSLRSITLKMVQHFANWARPRDVINVDEFVIFCAIFPVIDLSWRLGKDPISKEIHLKLSEELDWNFLIKCANVLVEAGFLGRASELSLTKLESRLDKYSNAYVSDRISDVWDYHNLRVEFVTNCFSSDHLKELSDSQQLVEDVIDRARSRVKKEFRKSVSKVGWWRNDSNGYEKRVRSFTPRDTSG
jgi:hypothetical protein